MLENQRYAVWLAGILIAGFALRFLLPGDRWFWYDEIYGATYAAQSLWDASIATLRFDLHPPLHSIQMSIWGWFSQSDAWLRLNSVAWGLLAVFLVYWLGRHRFGQREALLAAVILATLPAAVVTSQALRMYPMLMVLALLTWHFSMVYLRENGSRKALVGLALAGLAATYTHATGIFVPVTAGVFGLLVILTERPRLQRIRGWGVTQLAVALASVPAMGNTLVRSISHTTAPDLTSVWNGMATLLMSSAGTRTLVFGAIAAVLWLLLLYALVDRRIRLEILGYIVFPLVLTLLLSYLLRPVWHPRALYYVVPFLAMALSVGFVQVANGLSRITGDERVPWIQVGLAGFAAVVLATGALVTENLRSKPHAFPQATEYLKENIQDGDVVLAPHHAIFWGIARYWVGPHWGSATQIQGEPETARWQDIYDRMGDRLAWVGLQAETRSIPANGTRLYIGQNPDADFETAERIWLVHHSRVPEVDWLGGMGFEQQSENDFRGIRVRLFVRLNDD